MFSKRNTSALNVKQELLRQNFAPYSTHSGTTARPQGVVAIATSATAVRIIAQEVPMFNAEGKPYTAKGVDVTCAITSSGAGGLDTGTEANSTWYNIWLGYNGTTVSAVMGKRLKSSTTTSTTSNKLVDSGATFNTAGESKVNVGDLIMNTTDNDICYVTAVDSDTTLSVSSDIMPTSKAYSIIRNRPGTEPSGYTYWCPVPVSVVYNDSGGNFDVYFQSGPWWHPNGADLSWNKATPGVTFTAYQVDNTAGTWPPGAFNVKTNALVDLATDNDASLSWQCTAGFFGYTESDLQGQVAMDHRNSGSNSDWSAGFTQVVVDTNGAVEIRIDAATSTEVALHINASSLW